MSIVFYISGHGFGHASRQVEIINALGARTDEPLFLRTSVNPDLLRRTLRVPYTLDRAPCDTGIIQSTSIAHDDPATVRAALDFYATYPARVEAEAGRLAPHSARLVVGDIPPLAFAAAERLGVPAIAVGNFTWDWIYETHPGFLPAGEDVLDRIRASYRHAGLALELPFAGGFEIFARVEQLPLVARRATRSRTDTRAFFNLPAHGRVALLSFGGYGLPSLDLGQLDCRDDWTVVTTDSVTASGGTTPAHVRVVREDTFLSSTFRYEDLVAAADVVITKPGYGIIAECISTGTALLYTSRGQFREYDVLVAALPQLVRSTFVSQADLLGGRWREALETLVALPDAPTRIATNGAEVAAEKVLGFLGA